MERLTWYDRYGGAYADAGSVKIEEYDTAMVATGEAIVRLAAYEDTGLTPEEVAALRAQLEPDGWISVEEHEPNIDDEAVLLMDDGSKRLAIYLGEGDWGYKRFADGTWMAVNAESGFIDSVLPLPEPPREGKI